MTDPILYIQLWNHDCVRSKYPKLEVQELCDLDIWTGYQIINEAVARFKKCPCPSCTEYKKHPIGFVLGDKL